MVPARIYLDTNALPTSGSIQRGFMSLAVALSAHQGIQLLVPELVILEYRNMRLQSAREAAEKLRAAAKAAHDHLGIESLYIPDAEEIVRPIETELRSLVVPFEVHGDDAATALVREALRTPPAKAGKGARDSAIWLSVVRHHRESTGESVFITFNRSDFTTDEGTPHDALLHDLGPDAHRFRFVFRPFEFLEELAPKLEVPQGLAGQLESNDSVATELAHRVFDVAEWLEQPRAENLEILALHDGGGVHLAKVRTAIGLDGNEWKGECWLSIDGTTIAVLAVV